MSLFPKKKTFAGFPAEEIRPLFPKRIDERRPTDADGDDGDDDIEVDIDDDRRVGEYYDKDKHTHYGSCRPGDREIILGRPTMKASGVEQEMADLIYSLFTHEHHYSHCHPRTNPQWPPMKRFKRHRNFYIWFLNEFRHWWKTSRLLVRLSGGIVYAHDALNWATMAMWKVGKSSGQAKHALKQMKLIGQGGVSSFFLDKMQPFTRSIRIILAVARAWEARVDNRLYEVGLAEGFAFMGNRVGRYWTRRFVDWFTFYVVFPLSALFLAPYVAVQSRPIIMLMGYLRAILPFAMSFQGSRFGRQVTFNTYKYASYRWKATQGIMRFHEHTGAYQDTNLDAQLLQLARDVAEAIGHGVDAADTRRQLGLLGFKNYGSGSGGYSVYQMKLNDESGKEDDKIILLNVTPYGPSILDEMPRFIRLERRSAFYVKRLVSQSDGIMLDAATPREARVRGFTYSGAFFQAQEWAALRERHDRELVDYTNACKVMMTNTLPRGHRYPQELKRPVPPTDLPSLKEFIRSGVLTFKQNRKNARWNEIQVEVKKMAKLVEKYQKDRKAPTRVILYLEGLDCSGKSSTGMLICKALEECGYSVAVAQHNRPPTPEQSAKPWMDRIRFEYPEDMYDDPNDVPDYASLVWDRGPVGDFVYGKLDQLSPEEKMKRYREFRRYDFNCGLEGVLFFKCFFVTTRDAIAATLGKRLAHKQIAKDLRTWLDANSIPHTREGLEQIELHIDPTDFVAFNKYEVNLDKFSEVVRNTDTIGNMGEGDDSEPYENPWLVINTSNRHTARLSMMKVFRGHLERFAKTSGEPKVGLFARCKALFSRDTGEASQRVTLVVPSDIAQFKEHGLSPRAVAQCFVLFLLFYAYAYQTWHFDIEDIT